MNRIFIFLLAFGLLFAATAADTNKNSIIGRWRFVKMESSNKKFPPATGDMEMEFREGGGYTMKYVAPKVGVTNVQTVQGKFTQPTSNQVFVSINDKVQERYKYAITGDILRMEHQDFPVTNTLKRIDKFTLK